MRWRWPGTILILEKVPVAEILLYQKQYKEWKSSLDPPVHLKTRVQVYVGICVYQKHYFEKFPQIPKHPRE